MTTTRLFNSEEEFRSYAIQMAEDGILSVKYWNDLLVYGASEFKTFEPVNGTEVVSSGLVYKHDPHPKGAENEPVYLEH